jgi:hypothetical protein
MEEVMNGRWKKVVELKFDGERFRDKALDLSALTELSQFQKLVGETAKALWRAANPERERLPKNFDDRTRLCLREVKEGSAVAPLEVWIEEPDRPDLFESEPKEVTEAIELAKRVFTSVDRDETLPNDLPKWLVPHYAKFGKELAEREAIEVIVPRGEKAIVTPASRARLEAFVEPTYEAFLDVTGEVLEADVRQKRFQIWLDDRSSITVPFSEDQEAQVTCALRDHRILRMRVIGQGRFNAVGKPESVVSVEKINILQIGEIPYDSTARPIEDVLAELAAEVPEGEWDKLPSDLTDNLDHYLYGVPKR